MSQAPRDPLELDAAHITTRAFFAARGTTIPTAFEVRCVTVGGEVTDVWFASVPSLARFLKEMRPSRVFYNLARDESAAELDAELREAAAQLDRMPPALH